MHHYTQPWVHSAGIVGKPRRVQEYNLALKRQVCCQVQFNEMSIKKHCGMKTIGTHDGTFHCDEVIITSSIMCCHGYWLLIDSGSGMLHVKETA